MGQFQSVIQEIQNDPDMGTRFDIDEIKSLSLAFHRLDKNKSGAIEVEEFMVLPEWQNNPLAERIIDIFDRDGNGAVDFQEFLLGISAFSRRTDEERKLKLVFRVYDINNDGFISNGELFKVLKMMVGDNLNDIQLQQIVDKTILFMDDDKDGKISYPEFRKAIKEKGKFLSLVRRKHHASVFHRLIFAFDFCMQV